VAPTIGDAIGNRIVGAGLSLGSRTLVGPVMLSVHARSPTTALLELNIGHLF
jgi:hypothetical protein